MTNSPQKLADILWKIYHRSEKPRPTPQQIDQLWVGPTLTERILSEHLDDTHGAASRVGPEQMTQVDWLWHRLGLFEGAHLLDVTCGPGLYATKLAKKGCRVTGIDFSPTAIAYAEDLARSEGVAQRCQFIEQDIRQLAFPEANFDAAILLYGQFEALAKSEAQELLTRLAAALKPGGKLCLELLNQAQVDKINSSWWYTDDQGVWSDQPFLHLGERFWYADEELAIERYYIIHLETGQMDEVYTCNQTYSPESITAMLTATGFATVQTFPAWDDLPLYDAEEWMVYIGERN